jgi:Leucine-rich repeat (LRR) protein
MKKLILLVSLIIASCSTPDIITEPTVVKNPIVIGNPWDQPDYWTQIPDTTFEKCLIELRCDDVLDGKVIQSNVSYIKNLKLEHKRIKNITGIEAFTGLETLSLWDNDFTEINIRSLKNLKILCLSGCPLSTVDLSQNTELVEILFQNNPERANDPSYAFGKTKGFETLDLRNNKKLQRIYLFTNRIKSLDVSMCPNLTNLWLGLPGIPNCGNPIEHLDLSNNPKLDVITVANCKLKSLNIKNTANRGVPRSCATSGNPDLFEIKVSSVERITARANSSASNTWYQRDVQTKYVE